VAFFYLQDEIFKEKPTVLELFEPLFMFASCISTIKNNFIVPNDAHYYKIVEMLKEFTILKLQYLLPNVSFHAGTCRSKYYNFKIILTFLRFYNTVHQLEH
jgi:hypothetical protein